jgi:hypothetical protein
MSYHQCIYMTLRTSIYELTQNIYNDSRARLSGRFRAVPIPTKIGKMEKVEWLGAGRRRIVETT